MQKLYYFFVIVLIILTSFGNKAFAVCSGATNAGALSPTQNWQTISVNTYRYYTFTATYPGETFIFSFCQAGGSTGIDTQIEIYDNLGNPIAGAYNDDFCGLGSELTFTAPAAGTYRIAIYQFYCSTNSVAAGTLAYRRLPIPTSSDCLGALPLCNSNNSHPTINPSTGNYYDIMDFNYFFGTAISSNNCPNCLVTGEDYGMWYTFTAQTSGTLNFTIAPVGGDDYDFAVWKLTSGTNCNNLINWSANPPIRCNYCGSLGNTGVGGGANTCEGPNSCNNWNSTINVTAGETYVVLINNFSLSTNGYNINFSGTAAVVDNTGPSMTSIVYPPVCGSTNITVQFSERIWCTGTQPSDFVLTGPNGTYSIIDAYSAVCEAGVGNTYSGTFYDDLWTLTLGDAVSHDGNYQLCVIPGGVQDICSNNSAGNCLNFTITGITATVSHTNVTCYGLNNGTINVSGITGGTAPYTISWTGPSGFTSNSPNLTNLAPGTYNLTISDASGRCEYVDNVVITEPSQVGYNANITHPTCGGGGNDGEVLITGTGGVSPYNIQLGASTQNGVMSYNFTGLSGGSYTVNITDATGCIATGNVVLNTVIVPDASFTYNGNQCFNGHSFNFTYTGVPVGGQTYSWTFAGGTPATSNLQNPSGITWAAPGTYTVTLSVNAGGCIRSTNQNITIYPQPSPTVSTTDASCGICNGQATVNPAYNSYSWSNGGNTQTITNLCPNNYSVTVTDINSCTGTASGVVSNVGTIPTANVITTNPTCPGLCNGTATVNAVGPPTFTYNYSGGSTPNNQSTGGLCAGNYTVTIADGANPACFTVENFTISDPPGMVLNMASVDANCGLANGQASVTVGGSYTNPLSYNWSNGGTTGTITVAAGTYTVTVTDGNGCTNENTVVVNDSGVPFTISTTINNHVNCNGNCNGSATVTPVGAGPFTYNWSNGQTVPTATGLCAGNHSVTVTSAGCNLSDNITITQPPVLLVSITASSNPHCGLSDGSITASASGGTAPYNYLWNTTPPQNTATAVNIPSGNYTVTVTDNNGCTNTTNGILNDIGFISVSVTGTNVSCFGGNDGEATATTIGGSPNYTYNWSNGFNQTIPGLVSNVSGLSAGVISVTVTDNFGCTATGSTTLTQPIAITVNLLSSTPATCNGLCDGTATVSVSGGTAPYTYTWSSGSAPNSNNNSNLCAGAHSVIVTDNNSCTSSLNYNITEPAAILLNISTTPENCGMANGTATVSPVGGTAPFLYSWSHGGNVAGPTNTGLSAALSPYNVTVTDANGCSQTGSATITNVSGPTAIITASSDVTCNGFNNGWAQVSVAGGTPPYSYLWNTAPVQTNPTAINLGPGVYTVTVSDNMGCTTTASTTINQPAAISLNIVNPPINCFGACNGNMLANVAGGTAPYTFIWSNLQTTQTATNLCSGNYSVTVTDNNSCTAAASAFLDQSPAIIVTETLVQSNCGQSNGSIDLNVGGGSPPFTYQWSNGALSQDIWNVPAGTYTVTIVDNKGCQLINSYNLSDINGPLVTISGSNNPTCNSSCNGTLTASVTGGTGFFQYSWNTVPVQTTSTATNLCAGAYSVIVTDLNTGCVASAGATLIEPPALDVISGVNNASCSGQCNGTISLTPFGGTPNYSYNWTGAGVDPTAQNQSNLCAGNYSVIISDANNCLISRNFTITQPNIINIPITATPTSCFGVCTGSSTAAPSGGTPPYSYSWSPSGQTGSTAFLLCTGIHTVTVTDNNGCTATNNVFVDTPTPLQISDITVNDAQCNGSSNASISITVTGGTPPYDYVWDNGQVISNPFGLSAGQHCVTVIDNNGCTISTCIMVNQPPALNVNLIATNELCNGACNGTITAMPSGGVTPYSYLWSNTEVTPVINNLCSGIYNLTVTDANGCQAYSSTSIASPPILSIALQNIINPSCGNNDGSITIGAIGGTAPYTYNWSPISGSASTLSNIPAGNYTVTITDNNGCSTFQTISLNDVTGPSITNINITHPTCNGWNNGSAEVIFTSSTPNNTISWSNGQSTAQIVNLVSGSYTVTVTDDNGCQATGSAVLVQPDPMISNIATYQDVTCNGFCNGTATVVAFGGNQPYSYTWSSGATAETANNLCSGVYTVTVYDTGGCSTTSSVTISEPSPLSVTGTAVNTRCYGSSDGMITVHASGGSGNYFYSWPQIPANTPIVQGLSASAYTVIVYDATDASCFTSEMFIVDSPVPITATLATENSTCGLDNGVVYVNTIFGGAGGYNYLWNPGNHTGSYVGGLAPGQYTVTITDANNCTVSYNANVQATQSMTIDNVIFTGVTCYGYNDGFAQIFVSGGTQPYVYNWTPNVTNQSTANNLYAGVYSVEVVDQDGCRQYTQFPISSPEQVVAIPSQDITICIGQQAVVSASATGGVPPYVYTWQGLGTGQSFIVSPEATVNYVVEVIDSRGCTSAQANQMIEVLPPLNLVVTTPSAICVGQISTLVANATGGDGNYTYDWGNGIVTTSNTLNISPVVNTDLTVTVRDGCTTPPASVNVTAAVSPMPEVNIVRSPYTGCTPLTVTFDNNTENLTYSYYWEFDDFNSGVNNFSDLKRPVHTFNEIGNYNVMVVVTTPMGCKDTTRVLVRVHQGPIADFVAHPWSTGLFSPEISFSDASVGGIAWEWDFGDGSISEQQNPVHIYMAQGEFPVTQRVYSQQGCVDSVTKYITINEDHRIYFPTAINLRSPGNDEFYPIGVGVDVDNYQMTIYNRWGEVIFTTTDWNTHWKGRYSQDKGDYVPQGVYVYVVTLRDKYGKDYTYSGNVMVFK
jgi:PKD repeat protein